MRKRKLISILLMIILITNSLQLGYNPKIVDAETTQQRIFAGNNYNIEFVLDSYTEAEYNARIVIHNTSEIPIENWKMELSFPEEISNIYNASIRSHDSGIYIIKNAEWNQDIPANGEVSFGFSGTKSGEFCYPSSICIPNSNNQQLSPIPNDRYDVSFELSSSWKEGYIVTVFVKNKTNTTIEDWRMEFDFSDKIESIWDATLVSQDNSKVSIKNPDYKQNIEGNETIQFQFQVSSKNSFEEPKNVVLNSFEDSSASKTTVLIDNIYITDETVIEGKESSNRITLSLNGMSSDKQYEVKVFSLDNDNWNYINQLMDTGNLDVNGDEIKNDGVFSNYVSVISSNSRNIELKFVVYEDGVQIAEEKRTIVIVSDISEEAFIVSDQFAEAVSKYLNEYATTLKTDEKADISTVIQYINIIDNEGKIVREIEKISDFTAKVNLKNGLSFYVQLTDDRDMELMRRGSGDGEIDPAEDQEIEHDICYDYVLSKDVLLWSPFDTEWGDSDETNDITDIVSESLGKNNLTVLSDSNATIESLNNLSSYGLIIFSTHGINGEWLVTGEQAKSTTNYMDEILTGKVSTFINVNLKDGDSERYFMVHSTWFSSKGKNLPNSIVINNSCESTKTDKLWKVFQNNGAKTYIGYTGSVTNDYVTIETTEFVSGLLCDNNSIQESFEYSFDAYYDDGEFMNICGAGNMKLPFGIMNPDFENNLSGWTKDGDGRSISKLGGVKPTSGEKMAIISTGLGYTLEKGSIYQKVYIPEEATSMTFDWNFLSEEFLEFIGSGYDDPFNVTLSISDENNTSDVVLELGVNEIASMFNATEYNGGDLVSVSPEISFDRGDVWMTDWQTQIVDMSKYAGEFVTIQFCVQDAIDTVYTTAVLIDNIQFNAVFETCGSAQSISDDYSASVLRGKYVKNSDGKSCIFYRPTESSYEEGGFTKQATKLKKVIKYRYGYTNNSQVTVKEVRTENDFVKSWNSMTGAMDSVSLLLHGNYYALLLDDSDARQNLTVSPDGMVGSDDSAYRICDLDRKTIKTLNINSCNTGLLDAIDIQYLKKGEFGDYLIKGNVAQAFLESQNVNEVIAWDGSMSYNIATGNPKSSRTQGKFADFLKELENVRVYIPKRKKTTGLDIIYRLPKSKISEYQPNGKTIYYKDKGNMYVKYVYQQKISYPSSMLVPIGAPQYEKKTIVHEVGRR